MNRRLFAPCTVACATLLLAVGAPGVAAQDDVELLGRMYGARPPAAYYQLRAGTPGAFEFGRAWKARNPRLEIAGLAPDGGPRFEVRSAREAADGRAPRRFDAPAATLGPRGEAVEGTFRFPVVLGYFADDLAPPAYDAAAVQGEFFDGPNSRGQTIPEFYADISGGRVELEGRTYGWVQSGLTRELTTGGISGLGGRIGLFIHQILAAADDGSIDWGQFDNDGPDGLPDSGDDDGFVDVLVVIHPTSGAECGGDGQRERIWSHKWTLSSAYGAIPTPERPAEPTFATSSVGASGSPIRVDDYTIQPVLSCDDTPTINEIGVLAHELGHGFGLPDLYCTTGDCPSNGIGRWGLMGQGSWGCGSFDPARPCAMGAWSKSMLGWVDVETLGLDTDHGTVELAPASTAGTALRIDAADGSDEYYLLENRQRLGVDADVPGSGLLIWHVDPDYVAARWPINRVNPNPAFGHLGVRVVQADGRLDLEGGVNRSDAGDPFPGTLTTDRFHAGAAPQSITHEGRAAGVTLTGIQQVGNVVRFRATTGFRDVAVAVDGSGTAGLVLVDDDPLPAEGAVFTRAPYEALVLDAVAGEVMGPGMRRPFVEWADDPGASRRRIYITPLDGETTLTAVYGGEEVRLTPVLEGGILDVDPGALVTAPFSSDLWVPRGEAVSIQAAPTPGYAFLDWTGDWIGRSNPFTVTPTEPLVVGARFGLTFSSLATALAADRESLDAALRSALDDFGNRDGRYDVGDLRAYLRRGETPLAVPASASAGGGAPRRPAAGGGSR